MFRQRAYLMDGRYFSIFHVIKIEISGDGLNDGGANKRVVPNRLAPRNSACSPLPHPHLP